MAADDVDFVVAAYRDDGDWRVMELSVDLADDLDELREELRRFPSDVGVLGLVSVDEDFFVVLRQDGSHLRVLLSDATAIGEHPLADGVADVLDLPDPGDDDDPQPAGDLDLLSDLGMSALELGLLCDDEGLYPDEVLSDIARRIGFGDDFEVITA